MEEHRPCIHTVSCCPSLEADKLVPAENGQKAPGLVYLGWLTVVLVQPLTLGDRLIHLVYGLIPVIRATSLPGS